MASKMTEEELLAWWAAQFDAVSNRGQTHEAVAEAMFAVATNRLAVALGPQRLAHLSYMLSLQLFGEAAASDAAVAAARAGGRVQ